MSKIRSLVEVCNDDPFTMRVEDSELILCLIGLSKPIMCPYHSKKVSEDDIYHCVNPLYYFKEYEACEQ